MEKSPELQIRALVDSTVFSNFWEIDYTVESGVIKDLTTYYFDDLDHGDVQKFELLGSKAQELSPRYYPNYENTKATFTIVKTNGYNYGNELMNQVLFQYLW